MSKMIFRKYIFCDLTTRFPAAVWVWYSDAVDWRLIHVRGQLKIQLVGSLVGKFDFCKTLVYWRIFLPRIFYRGASLFAVVLIVVLATDGALVYVREGIFYWYFVTYPQYSDLCRCSRSTGMLRDHDRFLLSCRFINSYVATY